jgi:DNA-binding CsgD family transcriptional regulator
MPSHPELAVLNRYEVLFLCFDALDRLVLISDSARALLGTAESSAPLMSQISSALVEARAGGGGRGPADLHQVDRPVSHPDGVLSCRIRMVRADGVVAVAVLHPLMGRTERSSLLAGLTDREAQVARHIAAGSSARAIAAALGISVHTVRRHSERIFQKIGVRSRVVLARMLAGTRTAGVATGA